MKFISLITLISVAGVALGVMSLIVVISVMNGFDKGLREKILGTKSHLVIEDYYGIDAYKEVVEEVVKDPNVVGASPVILGQGLLRYGNTAFGVGVKGIDPDLEEGVTKLGEIIMVGSLDPLSEESRKAKSSQIESATAPSLVSISSLDPTYGGIILGKEVARNLFGIFTDRKSKDYEKRLMTAIIGKKVKFTSPVEEDTPAGRVPRSEPLEVAGVFDSGLYDYDATLVYISLPSAQRLYDRQGKASQIEMRLGDLNLVDDVASRLEERLDNRFGISFYMRTWKQMNQVFFRALQIEKFAMFIILVLIILVAAFNIGSTLIMVVMEKTKDIGILMSMGAKRRSIMAIFCLEGGVVGFFGTLFGSIAGIAICAFIKIYKIPVPGGGDIYYFDTLPVQMLYSDFFLIVFTTMAICFLASIYPAWQASRLIPTEALRYE